MNRLFQGEAEASGRDTLAVTCWGRGKSKLLTQIPSTRVLFRPWAPVTPTPDAAHPWPQAVQGKWDQGQGVVAALRKVSQKTGLLRSSQMRWISTRIWRLPASLLTSPSLSFLTSRTGAGRRRSWECVHTKRCTWIFTAVLFIIAQTWK